MITFTFIVIVIQWLPGPPLILLPLPTGREGPGGTTAGTSSAFNGDPLTNGSLYNKYNVHVHVHYITYLERTDILRGFVKVLVKVTLKRERDEDEDSSIKH